MRRRHAIAVVALILGILSAAGTGIADDDAEKAKQDVDRYVAQLKSADAMVRLRAAKALGDLGPDAKAALPALEALASDADLDVRGVAARAVEKIRAADVAAAKALIEKLGSTDPIDRMQAAKGLGAMGRAARIAIPALEALAADPDEDVRRVAANALKKIRAPADPTIRKWIEELGHKDPIVRIRAARSLGQRAAEAESAIPALTALAKDPDEDVRLVAAHALKRIRDFASDEPMTQALRALVAELKSPDPDVRKEAIYALGRMGAEAAPAMRYLEDALKDENPQVRIAAVEAMTVIRADQPVDLESVAGDHAGQKLEDKDILSPIWKSRKPKRGLLPPGYAVRTPEEARARIRTVLEGAVWTIDKAGLLRVRIRLPEGWETDFGVKTVDLGGPLTQEGNTLEFKLRSDGVALGAMVWLEGTVSRPDEDLVADIDLSIVGANMLSAKVLQRLERTGE